MDRLNEIELVQNPALGALIIAAFLSGYNKVIHISQIEKLFLVIPIIFNKEMRSYIQSTREKSEFSKVIEKMTKEKKMDVIYQLNGLIQQMKKLTLESIQIGIYTGLFFIDERI